MARLVGNDVDAELAEETAAESWKAEGEAIRMPARIMERSLGGRFIRGADLLSAPASNCMSGEVWVAGGRIHF